MMKIMMLTLMSTLLITHKPLFGQMISKPFEFQFEGKTLRGLIEQPQDRKPKALVVIVPGYGRTNFVKGKWFFRLRAHLVAAGLAVCLWDKMGCGGSEGEFDAQQPVENSADEALAAIRKIKQMKVTGSNKIGLWGLSRGGWICPLINQRFPIDFWISVSGTDDKENFGYLLKSNLMIAGKSPEEADRLHQAWRRGHQIICTKGSYKAYLKAMQPLGQDDIGRKLLGYTPETKPTKAGEQGYLKMQQSYTRKGRFDPKSGLWVYLENFDKVLGKINCPVLALFGENDSQVNWRKTKKLYEQTIGKNAQASLTIKTFKNCNHSLQKCRTCAYREDLSALQWQACDNYYKTMKSWLKKNKIVE